MEWKSASLTAEPERTSSASDASDQKQPIKPIKAEAELIIAVDATHLVPKRAWLHSHSAPTSTLQPAAQWAETEGRRVCAGEAAASEVSAGPGGGGGGALVAWIGDRIGEWKWVDWLPVGFWRFLLRALSVTDTPSPPPSLPPCLPPLFPCPYSFCPLFQARAHPISCPGRMNTASLRRNCRSSHPSGAIVDPTPERMKRTPIYGDKNTSHVPPFPSLQRKGVKQPRARWRREERRECSLKLLRKCRHYRFGVLRTWSHQIQVLRQVMDSSACGSAWLTPGNIRFWWDPTRSNGVICHW